MAYIGQDPRARFFENLIILSIPLITSIPRKKKKKNTPKLICLQAMRFRLYIIRLNRTNNVLCVYIYYVFPKFYMDLSNVFLDLIFFLPFNLFLLFFSLTSKSF